MQREVIESGQAPGCRSPVGGSDLMNLKLNTEQTAAVLQPCSPVRFVVCLRRLISRSSTSPDRYLKDFGGQSCARREMPVRHTVCHQQREGKVLLDKEVEDCIQARSPSAEDTLSERLGRSRFPKRFYVCITGDVEYLRSDSRYLVLRRD